MKEFSVTFSVDAAVVLCVVGLSVETVKLALLPEQAVTVKQIVQSNAIIMILFIVVFLSFSKQIYSD